MDPLEVHDAGEESKVSSARITLAGGGVGTAIVAEVNDVATANERNDGRSEIRSHEGD